MARSRLMGLYIVASIFCLGMLAGGFFVQWRYAEYEALWQERFEKQQAEYDALLLACFANSTGRDEPGSDLKRFLGVLKAVSKE